MNKKINFYRKSVESLMKVRKIEVPVEDLVFSYEKGRMPLPSEFKILVWNIFKSNGGVDFFEDLLNLANGAHILCLQEVLKKTHPLIGNLHVKYNYYFASSYTRSDGHCDGVLTATTHDIDDKAFRVQSLKKEPIAKTPKVGLITFIPMEDGDQLAVVNLHSILFRSIHQSERELANIMEQLEPFSGPAILAGDLNTFTEKYLNRARMILAKSGFELVELLEDPRPKVKRLDHIFIRGLKTQGVRVLDEIQTSDHLPLVATLRK